MLFRDIAKFLAILTLITSCKKVYQVPEKPEFNWNPKKDYRILSRYKHTLTPKSIIDVRNDTIFYTTKTDSTFITIDLVTRIEQRPGKGVRIGLPVAIVLLLGVPIKAY